MQKELMSLREVCLEVNTTRSAIQGFERMGLVSASGTNKYGYLLYDEDAVSRIAMVCFMQKLKFSLKQVKEVIDMPQQDLIKIISDRIEILDRQTNEYLEFLRKSERIISDSFDSAEILKLLENKGE